MKVLERQTVAVPLLLNGQTEYTIPIPITTVRFKPTHVIVRQITLLVAAPSADFVTVESNFTGDNIMAILPVQSQSVGLNTVIPVTGDVIGNKQFIVNSTSDAAISVGLLLEFIQEAQ